MTSGMTLKILNDAVAAAMVGGEDDSRHYEVQIHPDQLRDIYIMFGSMEAFAEAWGEKFGEPLKWRWLDE